MPKPLWTPGQDRVDRANLSRFMRFVREEAGNADLNSYAPLWRLSVEQPAKFWTLLWDFVGIRGSGERSPVLVDDEGMASARWFPGVNLNFAHNLLRFDDERTAIRTLAPEGERALLTYAQLNRRVAALSAAMRAAGVAPGDRVAALLPNGPEAIVAMLAAASVGAAWFTSPSSLSQVQAATLQTDLSAQRVCHPEAGGDERVEARESQHDDRDHAFVELRNGGARIAAQKNEISRTGEEDAGDHVGDVMLLGEQR